MHWKCDDRVMTDRQTWTLRPTCSLLSNNLRAVVDSGERVWCILMYLRAIFVGTPTGEVSEVEIFLRFDGVPEPALLSVFARTCSQPSVFFHVHPLSVRELTFTCMRGSVIFSNMLDFAVYVRVDYVRGMPSRRLRRHGKPLVITMALHGPRNLCQVGAATMNIIIMMPSIIDVWGYDREFCSSSPPPPPPPSPPSHVTQKLNNIK